MVTTKVIIRHPKGVKSFNGRNSGVSGVQKLIRKKLPLKYVLRRVRCQEKINNVMTRFTVDVAYRKKF